MVRGDLLQGSRRKSDTYVSTQHVMQTDIRNWYGARPVVHQAGTAPGPQPQRGPPSATGGKSQRSGGENIETINEIDTSADKLLTIVQWNAEGLRRKKTELQEFLRKEKVDIMCIQETHLTEAHRFFVRGFETFRHDRANQHKGGLVTLVKNTIPAAELQKSLDTCGTEYLTVKVILEEKELQITNVYCSPEKELKLNNLPTTESNTIIVGDFNSHSPSWGYTDLDKRGEEIEDWTIDKNLLLLNKPSDPPTFWSRAWKTSSSPDLAFATEDLEKNTTRAVQDQLGGSDHRPILLKIHNSGSVGGRSKCREPSWNYKKANWTKFEDLTSKFCNELGAIETTNLDTNVKRFTEAVLKAAKWSIPRGRRVDYKPYWSPNLEILQNKVNEARNIMEEERSQTTISAHKIATTDFEEAKITETQRAWKERTESLDMERNSG